MIKKWLFTPLFVVLFFVSSCDGNITDTEDEITPIYADDLITMDNLDEFMFRDDVQYVDLRNYEARFKSGFIYSFEIIPFFDYLDFRVFDRGDTYEFKPDQLLLESELDRLFDRNRAIFLYDDGCIRSGYLKDVLMYLGFERVFVLGGYYEYEGVHRILGDGRFSMGKQFYGKYEDEDSGNTYYMYGLFDLGKKIIEIRFDIIDSNTESFRTQNYSEEVDYNSQLTILEDFIVNDIVTMNELHSSLTDVGNTSYDNIKGFEWEIDPNLIELIFSLIAS